MTLINIATLLKRAARFNDNAGIITYPSGQTTEGLKTSYAELLEQAEQNAQVISAIPGFTPKSIVLIHLDDHFDNINLFWAVVLAGGIPCVSTPFTNIPAQRESHIRHLASLLDSPICITRNHLLPLFSGQDHLASFTLEGLSGFQLPSRPDDLALLMLTSGSTGNAKAVRLTHAQMITAVAAKCEARPLPPGSPFLNWIGFDHVACVTEIHLQAMFLCVDQFHVQASDIVSSPQLFLRLLSEHEIGKSFGPNFYLALVKKFLETEEGRLFGTTLNLTHLRWLASGGEPNVVEMCSALSRILEGYGAPHDVIMPGFGMTETCAGSIWNTNFPDHDIGKGHQFAALGKCQPGIEMRVVTNENGIETVAPADHPGFLEVRGPIVFQGYFNNPKATAEAISPDGWFRTGDQAMIDWAGNLSLIGRHNDHININGVKYLPNELEAAIEGFNIPGVTPHYTVCFSIRTPGSQTEQVCVVYLPSYAPDDVTARMTARDAITQATMLHTGSQPRVLPLNSTFLMKSTLGKLSRVKIRISYEKGEFKDLEEFDNEQIRGYSTRFVAQPRTIMESVVRELYSGVLEVPAEEFGVETPVFEMGITSIHLIQLKKQLQTRLSIEDIPISVIMTNPTIRGLCGALEVLEKPKEYDPVVVLQGNGDKTPIWLFHPGVGEVLVFLGLAKYLQGRPVYALRARGFETGHAPFDNIQEVVSTYHAAIKAKQPHGPYALAGYSYGTMLAFETSKVLQATGDQIAFLGSLNLPPHIKERMRQLEWSDCLLHLCYFLGLVGPDAAERLAPQFSVYRKEEAMAEVMKLVDQPRMAELALTSEALSKWADLSYGLQSMARQYEPSGSVPVIDVFVAEPLKIVAENKEAWVRERLSKWADFCETEPRFHYVDGEHYTMIGEKHVYTFQETFRKALEGRGL
ncbi:putative non-ribosomal peptide synthase-like protein [Coniochaeta sp. 2T2.1]|nr:putative non-ribosomal peptide synthase-like protein [Coniochaeta sp. 2T2.1]